MFKFLLAATVAGHLLGFGVSTDSFKTMAACQRVLPAKMHVMQSVTQHALPPGVPVKVIGKCAPAADVDKAAVALKALDGAKPVKKPGTEI
jgi:hypothetical protein